MEIELALIMEGKLSSPYGQGQSFETLVTRISALSATQQQVVADSFLSANRTLPLCENDTTVFFIAQRSATTLSVTGDASNWDAKGSAMTKIGATNLWYCRQNFEADARLDYKFVVNGDVYLNDPRNPVRLENYNKSGSNSGFVLTESGNVELTATPPAHKSNTRDTYPQTPDRKPVYLNVIWHQHQPLYLNPSTDQLDGPWVRTLSLLLKA